jgi:cell wall assembly regulator SMI1
MNKYKEKMDCFNTYDVGVSNRPTLKNIEQIENEIGSSLPNDYVNFLLNYGGLALSMTTTSFYRSDTSQEMPMVEILFGFSPDHTYDIIENYHTYRERMPINLIPIASDGGGGEICISLHGDDKGAVYYWDRYLEEDPEEGEEIGYSNVFLIARTFDDFINSLEIYDDEAEEE